eukprot:TRINITY_DN274_c1_g1_i4.p1 TRINITY_DN274_c1_g1~~TRINITY_DN274_c1_g1_i4.p1  ORF type:complete len:212 (+),score=38.12 TRINITY_DN274_c1_g1_i4:20-655(+)
MSKIERPRDVRRSYDKYTVKELSDMESSSSISEIHLKNNNTDIHANDVSAGVVRVEEESVDGDDRIYIHPRRDTDRTLKIYICIIWVLVCFGSPFAVSYLDFYAAIALGIGLINLFFYVLWGYSLWKSKELYSVKVLLKKIKHWLPISVPVGTVFLGDGAIGAVSRSPWDDESHNRYLAARSDFNHFIQVEVQNNRIYASAVNTGNEIFIE